MRIEECSNCKDSHSLENLYWADKGGLVWLCQPCFYVSNKEVAV